MLSKNLFDLKLIKKSNTFLFKCQNYLVLDNILYIIDV